LLPSSVLEKLIIRAPEQHRAHLRELAARHLPGLAWIFRQSDFLGNFAARCKILPGFAYT